MRLDELLEIVAESTAADWEKLDIPTPYTGPSEDREADDGQRFHHTLAVYRPDVDIGLSWGGVVVRPYWEPWVDNFRGEAHSFAVWLLYRGMPVYEWVVVCVDGGRTVLPVPGMRDREYILEERRRPMAGLFFHLLSSFSGEDCLDSAIRRAGWTVVCESPKAEPTPPAGEREAAQRPPGGRSCGRGNAQADARRMMKDLLDYNERAGRTHKRAPRRKVNG